MYSCQYLAERYLPGVKKEGLLGDHSVCLCDDDNDLEMALACRHAYIPEISSRSMADIIQTNPEHFTQTGGEGKQQVGTDATEAALALLMGRITEDDRTRSEAVLLEDNVD